MPADVEDIDKRVREVETTTTRLAMLFDSPAGPGMLSTMKSELLTKIDGYATTVNTFIAAEPARKQHIENNAKQSVMDAKTLAEIALRTAEEKQMRLHEENKRDRVDDRREIDKLAENDKRLERFIQRGVGILIAGQLVIVLCGFAMSVLAFLGAFLWWVVVHAHDIPVK